MKSINVTSARTNLYKLISDVNENNSQITITNRAGKNAVLLSEDDWNTIQETLYLNSIPGLVQSILDKRDELSECSTYDPNEDW